MISIKTTGSEIICLKINSEAVAEVVHTTEKIDAIEILDQVRERINHPDQEIDLNLLGTNLLNLGRRENHLHLQRTDVKPDTSSRAHPGEVRHQCMRRRRAVADLVREKDNTHPAARVMMGKKQNLIEIKCKVGMKKEGRLLEVREVKDLGLRKGVIKASKNIPENDHIARIEGRQKVQRK